MNFTKELTQSDLDQFCGSEHYYFLPLFPACNYTDGVKFLAERGNAYWLLDLIFSAQISEKVRGEEFQSWHIDIKPNTHEGIVTATDGKGKVIYMQKLPYTDFPFNLKLFYTNNVLLLPSEY